MNILIVCLIKCTHVFNTKDAYITWDALSPTPKHLLNKTYILVLHVLFTWHVWINLDPNLVIDGWGILSEIVLGIHRLALDLSWSHNELKHIQWFITIYPPAISILHIKKYTCRKRIGNVEPFCFILIFLYYIFMFRLICKPIGTVFTQVTKLCAAGETS